MSNRYVRIYKGPENTDVIGFSLSAAPEKSDGFEEFLTEKGYGVKKYERGSEDFETMVKDLGGTSCTYYGIEPPLKPDDEKDLGRWCAAHIDAGNNFGFLIDNRESAGPLSTRYLDQRTIKEW